jgi:murein DD-endopeptidase MepM/ murein hydrolase activator NlpD
MAESPLYVQFPAEAAIQAHPSHDFHIPFLPRSAHLRHLIAIGLGGAASIGLLAAVIYPLLARHTIAQAVQVARSEVAQPLPSMPKANRLANHKRFDGSRFAQVAETLSSGETRIFTYHRLTLVFKGDGSDYGESIAMAAPPEIEDGTPVVPKFSLPPLADMRNGIYSPPGTMISGKRSRFPIRGVPLNVSYTSAEAPPVREIKRLVSMPKNRQELADVLQTAGLGDENRDELVQALATDAVSPGDSLELLMEKSPIDGQPKLIMAKLNGDKGEERVVARDDSDGFVALSDDHLFSTLYSETQPEAPSSTEVAAVDLKGVRDGDQGGLQERLERAGLPEDAAIGLMKLAASKGITLGAGDNAPDNVDLLFRKSEDDGQQLMFIEFHSGDEAHRFYLHRNGPDALSEFYDEDGHSVAKYLAHRPVPGGKLGDGFAWRIHPILGVKKFHNGVDFRAPMGTPILAAGDGTVEKIDFETGYGKYVRIRHDGGYETTYAHIASTPRDLRVGQRVAQGEVIAYVGSTGYSTGPHLYYELRVNGQYENPLTASLPAGTNLTGKSLDNLRSQVTHVDSILSYLDVSAPAQAKAFSSFERK